MVWVECLLCGEFKMVRLASIKAGLTVSCGCHGRKQFVGHHEAVASKIAPATRQAIFEQSYAPRSRRVERTEIAKRFHTTKYVVDFLIALHIRFIRAAAALGRKAASLLSKVELKWMTRFVTSAAQRDRLAARKAMLDAMPWRDREAYLAAERERERTAWSQVKAAGGFMNALRDALDSPDAEVSLI